MDETKRETTEMVAGEIVENETQVIPAGKMEFRLINPTESGFLTKIIWNKEELETAVRAKIAAYTDVIYAEENMKQAKDDRAELNKLAKAIEERRKKVKEIVNRPYADFETEIKEILQLIQKPIDMIDMQIKGFEMQQKEEKKKKLREIWSEAIGNMEDILPFERIFDQRYLNATYKFGTASAEIKEKVERFKTDLETIDSLDSKYKLNAKDVYINTLNLSKALAENKRLVDLERRMEEERKRKDEEEHRKEEERQAKLREEEERRSREEENKKKVTLIERGCITGKNPNGTCACCGNDSTVECCEQCQEDCNGRCGWLDCSKNEENVSETPESVSVPGESATGPVSSIGKVIDGIEHQAFDMAVKTPIAPQPAEKLCKAAFTVYGTRKQIMDLKQYMIDNNIKFGKVEK